MLSLAVFAVKRIRPPFFSCCIQVFSGAVVGASVVDDGDVDEGPAPGVIGGEVHLYQVIGTLQEEQSSKPAWVSDIVKVC